MPTYIDNENIQQTPAVVLDKFPQQTEPAAEDDVLYAGIGARFFAFVIDNIIKWAIIGCARLFFFILGFSSSVLSSPVLFNFSLLDIAAYIAGVSYFILMTYAAGATIGKFAMRIKVIPKNGEKLSLINVIYRETIGRYLSSLFYIGYIIAPFHPKKQALHDILSDTYVIYSFNPSKIKVKIIPKNQPVSYNVPV